MKFKEGDRVRIVHDEEWLGLDYTGAVGEVVSVDVQEFITNVYVLIDGQKLPYSVNSVDLEKVSE